MRRSNHNFKPIGGRVYECQNARQRSAKMMPIVMLQRMIAAAILFQTLPTTSGFTSKLSQPVIRHRTQDRPSPPPASFCSSRLLSALTQLSSSTLVGSEGGDSTTRNQQTSDDTRPDPSIDIENSRPLDVNIVLIDNYDSYTYNLYQYLACICVNPPVVVANDAYGSWEELLDAESAANRRIDAIVISPGPGTPTCEKDVGICQEVVRSNPQLPILGVCLGHQLLGHHYGADVTLSPGGPVHGMVSPVAYNMSDETVDAEVHEGHRDRSTSNSSKWNLFDGIEQDFGVVRYHSLAVQFPSEGDLAASLEIEPMAWCEAVPPSPTADGDASVDHAEQNDEKTSTKICMALKHKTNPHYGVQFHPESIGTGKAGYQILYNFCKHVEASQLTRGSNDSERDPSITQADPSTQKVQSEHSDVAAEDRPTTTCMHTVHVHKISPMHGSSNPIPEVVFEELYGSSPSAFWLDSSTGEVSDVDGNLVDPIADKRKCPIRSNSRFSIMGDDQGPLSKRVEYYGEDHDPSERGTRIFNHQPGETSDYDLHHEHDNILEYLRKSMGDSRGVSMSTRLVHFENAGDESYTFQDVHEFSSNGSDDDNAFSSALPFEYRGGYVGYLGYEVRHESRKFLCEQEICSVDGGASPLRSPLTQVKSNRNIPTAAFLFADRSLVYDHFTSDWYLVGVSSNEIHAAGSGGVVSTVEWMQQLSSKLQSLQNHLVANNNPKPDKKLEINFHLDRSKAQYEEDIRRCHEEIKNGESYELCLTNQMRSTVGAKGNDGPFGLYKILRRRNPAPFSAFFRLDRLSIKDDDVDSSRRSNRSASVSICCSSPERFLAITKLVETLDEPAATDLDDDHSHGWEFAPRRSIDSSSDDLGYRYQVESKPIKGTTARIFAQDSDDDEMDCNREDAKVAEELRLDVKNRAENLMIVDLLRNDLSRVCEVGSVHVPRLMHIESFTTVHQLVSTIRGVINSMEVNAADVISACFPGGSMTGAPKLRSVDILNDMEQGVSRGPYSGSLGYISLNGCMDMNIIIRTAVVTPANGPEDVTEEEEENNDEWDVSIGCGGAITALSDSEDEYNEMLLKARAIKEAVEYWASGTD